MKDFFTLHEMVKTDTGLDNSFDTLLDVRNLERLMIVLSVLRHLVQECIHVNSGYRSYDVNDSVGGVSNSKHRIGKAADIRCKDMRALEEYCKLFHRTGVFTECVVHETYIHVAI